jgi:hypothetical protein
VFHEKGSDNFPRGITYGSTCQTSSTCTNVKSPGLTQKTVLGDVYSGLKVAAKMGPLGIAVKHIGHTQKRIL